jgi:hypothetical protein
MLKLFPLFGEKAFLSFPGALQTSKNGLTFCP